MSIELPPVKLSYQISRIRQQPRRQSGHLQQLQTQTHQTGVSTRRDRLTQLAVTFLVFFAPAFDLDVIKDLSDDAPEQTF